MVEKVVFVSYPSLLDWVLHFSIGGSPGITFDADMIFWQRTLGAMRLTCRFWGHAIRWHLFRNVTILSSSSYDRFTHLLDSDESIGELIHSVELRDASEVPWSHRVFLSTTMSKLNRVDRLHICGSNHTSIVAQRQARPPSLSGPGIYALVYRTFGGIRELTLNGISFASFYHIRHLFKGLLQLQRFIARVLVWPETQTAYGVMKLDAPRLSYTSVAGCVDNLIGVGLLLAAPISLHSPRPSRPVLDGDTRNAILTCTRAFTEGWKGAKVASWQFNPRLQQWYAHMPRFNARDTDVS